MADGQDAVKRFLSGTINRCHLSTTDRYGNYSVHIDGAYEDTMDTYDGYFQSKYPVPVYAGDEDPIDAEKADGKKFKGRLMITQKEYEGKTYYFLNAVSIEGDTEDDEEFQDQKNPFLENPL